MSMGSIGSIGSIGLIGLIGSISSCSVPSSPLMATVSGKSSMAQAAWPGRAWRSRCRATLNCIRPRAPPSSAPARARRSCRAVPQFDILPNRRPERRLFSGSCLLSRPTAELGAQSSVQPLLTYFGSYEASFRPVGHRTCPVTMATPRNIRTRPMNRLKLSSSFSNTTPSNTLNPARK